MSVEAIERGRPDAVMLFVKRVHRVIGRSV